MTEKRKRFLKRMGKGALLFAATGGAYILAKGTLHLILNLLDPKKEISHEPVSPASPPSAQTRVLSSAKSKASGLGL